MATLFLNGQFHHGTAADLTVSILDRGFIFGDGIYEVIPVYNGQPFYLEAHLERLERGFAFTRIGNPYSRTEWQQQIRALIEANGGGDQALYLQVTRGAAPRDHRFPADTPSTVFMQSSPLKVHRPDPVTAITAEDTRWLNCHIKTINLLGNVLLRQQAIDAGCAETLLFRGEELTEGAASNTFIVQAGVVATPPLSRYILPGITRQVAIQLMAVAGIPFQERTLSRQEVLAADEVWMSSSTKELVPIVAIDGQPVGNGRAGAVWEQLYTLLQHHKAAGGAGG